MDVINSKNHIILHLKVTYLLFETKIFMNQEANITLPNYLCYRIWKLKIILQDYEKISFITVSKIVNILPKYICLYVYIYY